MTVQSSGVGSHVYRCSVVLMSLQVSLDGQEASSREQVSLCVCCEGLV